MATTAEVLNASSDSELKEVTLKVSTGKGDHKVEHEFQAKLPTSLGCAERVLGSKAAHRFLINALVVDLQGEERSKLQPKDEAKPRKKAPYLETLGIA